MKTKFKLMGLVFLLCIINAMTVLGADTNTNKKIYYNNYDVNSMGIKQNGEYYLPLKEVVEQVSFKVTYDENTKTTKVFDNVDTATVNSKGELTSDGKVVDTKCVPIIKDGKTYVPLTFFSKGLGFGVSETNERLKLYGKNLYRLGISTLPGSKNPIQVIEVHSKQYDRDVTPIIPLGDVPKNHSNSRLSVYRTKSDNDIIEYYEYRGKDVYPVVSTFYNVRYLAMEYTKADPKSYRAFPIETQNIKPTQDDFDYYAKPLEDRVVVDGDKIAFVDLTSNDEQNGIHIYVDSTFGRGSLHQDFDYTSESNEKLKLDHAPNDRVVRIESINDNQLKCDVRTIADVTGEVRESILTVNEDGTVTEVLGESKNSIKVVYNGEELELGKPGAVIIDGSVYIPLRVFSQELGYAVGWDNSSKTVNIKNDTDEIYIDMKGNAKINGVESFTDKTPKLIQNTTYVPLRFVSEAFAIKVDWDSATKTVNMVQ